MSDLHKPKKPSDKTRRKESTGTRMELFIGAEWSLEGFLHVQPPRWSPQYEKMTVAELARRAMDDIHELVARAHPTYQEEWAKKFAPVWWREWGVPHGKRCHSIDEKVANGLRSGLWERMNSENQSVAEKAYKEATELLKKHDEDEPKHAAEVLALLAQEVAARLENLSEKRTPLMQAVAKKFESWPVLLSIEVKAVRKAGKRKVIPTLSGWDFAKDYLLALGVSSLGHPYTVNRMNVRARNPFRSAAHSLYDGLVWMRRDSRFWFMKMTPWAKKLLLLSEPMTAANADEWWKLAKVWLDEEWERKRERFHPFVKHLRLDPNHPKPYTIKKRVIDDSLKKAFKALALPVEW